MKILLFITLLNVSFVSYATSLLQKNENLPAVGYNLTHVAFPGSSEAFSKIKCDNYQITQIEQADLFVKNNDNILKYYSSDGLVYVSYICTARITEELETALEQI